MVGAEEPILTSQYYTYSIIYIVHLSSQLYPVKATHLFDCAGCYRKYPQWCRLVATPCYCKIYLESLCYNAGKAMHSSLVLSCELNVCFTPEMLVEYIYSRLNLLDLTCIAICTLWADTPQSCWARVWLCSGPQQGAWMLSTFIMWHRGESPSCPMPASLL